MSFGGVGAGRMGVAAREHFGPGLQASCLSEIPTRPRKARNHLRFALTPARPSFRRRTFSPHLPAAAVDRTFLGDHGPSKLNRGFGEYGLSRGVFPFASAPASS